MSLRFATPPFTTAPVTVRAPATSANLGPGFDSFGLALARYDTVTATVVGAGLTVDVSGEGAGELPPDERHLVVRALRATLDTLGLPQPALRLACRNTIPQGRGLGSSAAAIVTGIRLAEALATSSELRPGQDLALATALEGHSDNVTACLRGGFTIAWTSDDPTPGASEAVRLDVHPGVRPVLIIAPSPLPTSASRACLPASVPHRDASGTAARAGLLTAALTTYPELLFAGTEDHLHQEHRRSAMPQSLGLIDRLRRDGFAAVLSGAGPSVLVLASGEQPGALSERRPPGWTTSLVQVDQQGAVPCTGHTSEPPE